MLGKLDIDLMSEETWPLVLMEHQSVFTKKILLYSLPFRWADKAVRLGVAGVCDSDRASQACHPQAI